MEEIIKKLCLEIALLPYLIIDIDHSIELHKVIKHLLIARKWLSSEFLSDADAEVDTEVDTGAGWWKDKDYEQKMAYVLTDVERLVKAVCGVKQENFNDFNWRANVAVTKAYEHLREASFWLEFELKMGAELDKKMKEW